MQSLRDPGGERVGDKLVPIHGQSDYQGDGRGKYRAAEKRRLKGSGLDGWQLTRMSAMRTSTRRAAG
jgi:hypothetical protein